MTQIQFNLNLDLLKESVMNSCILTLLLKASIVLVLNSVMENERDDYLQVGAYERSTDRLDSPKRARFSLDYWYS